MSCVRWSTSSRSSFQIMITILIRSPRSFVILSRLTTSCHTLSSQSFFFNMATALLSSLFLDLLSAVHQTDDVRMRTFHQIGNHSSSCRTSILEDAIFHKVNWCNFLWGNPCRAIETFFYWDFCLSNFWFLWDFGFSTHFSHSAAQKSSEEDSAVSILHAYWYCDGNCNCLL